MQKLKKALKRNIVRLSLSPAESCYLIENPVEGLGPKNSKLLGKRVALTTSSLSELKLHHLIKTSDFKFPISLTHFQSPEQLEADLVTLKLPFTKVPPLLVSINKLVFKNQLYQTYLQSKQELIMTKMVTSTPSFVIPLLKIKKMLLFLNAPEIVPEIIVEPVVEIVKETETVATV